MIIICKECSTKFRLDESLLKETGSKVRCCACKYIFTAYPPQTLGRPEVSQPLPSQQGYFDSEEELGSGGAASGLQSTSEEDDDDDGLELDVGEEDDDELETDGIDLGDDDTDFDDGGIDLGNTMSGADTGMNFDADMDTDDGMPGIDFDSDNNVDELDLSTEINLNLDQGEEIDLDVESDMKKDSDETQAVELEPYDSETEPEIEPDEVDDENLSDEDDFEFEFELDEEEKFEIDDALKLDEPSAEIEELQEDQDIDSEVEEELELSLYDDENIDESSKTAEFELIEEETSSMEKIKDNDKYESVELEIDDDIFSDDDDDDDDGDDENFEIEEIDDEYEEDENYEIEEYDDDLEYEDNDIIVEEDENESEIPTLGGEAKATPKKSGKLLKILLTILIVLVVGYGAYTTTGGFTKGLDLSKINFSIVKNLFNFSKMDEIPVWATINNQSLNGRYVNNEIAGKLFVITGKITNESSIPLSYIQVEGTLISKGGVVAKKKKVYCGNEIPEGQLSSWSVGAINKILQRKEGEQGVNRDIKTNESIPFMVVFSTLPEELENYTVTVTDSDRMKK